MNSRLILLALVLGAGAQTPVYTFNGPLSCGARVYAPNQVQTYCLLTVPGQGLVTVCNHLDMVFPLTPPLSILLQGFNACQVTQPASLTPGDTATVYWVDWLLWTPSGGSIHYQIGSGQWPCTVDQNGNCEITTTPSPTGTIQSGTF